MFDQLIEESPMIQSLRAQSREQGLEQGLEQGRQEGLQALQRTLVNVVRARYPDLAELAQQQACRFNTPGALELLIRQAVTVPDASTAQWLLTPICEKRRNP
jgi:predicted transposase YdaD